MNRPPYLRDRLLWHPAPDTDSAPIPGVFVSRDGEVWDDNLGRYRDLTRTPNGYLVVRLRGKWRYLHVLVLEAFVGPRPDPDAQACHRDDDKDNNVLENLYWGSRKDNMADLSRNGGRTRLTRAQAAEIRARYTHGETIASIARDLGVRYVTAQAVAVGRNWTRLTPADVAAAWDDYLRRTAA